MHFLHHLVHPGVPLLLRIKADWRVHWRPHSVSGRRKSAGAVSFVVFLLLQMTETDYFWRIDDEKEDDDDW